MGKLFGILGSELLKVAEEHPDLIKNALVAVLQWIPEAIAQARAKAKADAATPAK